MRIPTTRRDERGAFLLIFSLCLFLVIILVAFAVDLGQARFSKRDNQQLADLASIAAGRQLGGFGSTSSGSVVSRPRDACREALNSIQTNADDFRPMMNAGEITSACTPFPVTSSGCDATTAPIQIAPVIRGPYAVTIRWPIPDTEIQDTRFSGAGTNDGDDQCQRMRIDVQRTDQTSFAGIIGTGSVTTVSSVVVRGFLDSDAKVTPAFLILERTRCNVLGNSVGASSLGIQVLGVTSTDQPGIIHADTDASQGCSGNAADSVGVYGTPLPSGAPSIFLHPAPTSGDPGELYVRTTSNPAKTYPTGINVSPLLGDIISRQVVDDIFNSTANPAVTELHARARAATTLTIPAGVSGDGWKRFGCNLETLDPADVETNPNWYVECPAFSATGAGIISNLSVALNGTPERVIFSGDVSIGNGQILDFATSLAGDIEEVTIKGKLSAAGLIDFGDAVERVYVGGATSGNAKPVLVTNNGSLIIRATALPTMVGGSMAGVCAQTAQAGRAEFVVFGDDGPNLDSAGNMAMCNTTLYLAGNPTATYTKQALTSGGTCSVDLPCPLIGNPQDAGYFEFNGLVDWTAPNESAVTPAGPRVLEDLLFWSESSATSDVKAGAQALTSGVFAAPNMNVEFRSPATGTPRNAQFIARRLWLNQGTLYMSPLPSDSVPIPSPGGFAIIR